MINLWFYLSSAIVCALYIAGFVLLVYLIKLVKVLIKKFSQEERNQE